MGTTTISLSNEAYRALKAQKRQGESFSELILRKFGKGNPTAILAFVNENDHAELADSIEKAIRKNRK